MHTWEARLQMLEKKVLSLGGKKEKLSKEELKDFNVLSDKKAHQLARAKKLALRNPAKTKLKNKDKKPEKAPKTRGPKRRNEEE